MKTISIVRIALATLCAGASFAAQARAAGSDESAEATALQKTKVTLSQAIATAEHRTSGKAFDAGVDIKSGVARISVETNGPAGVQTVIVDARSGRIVSSHAGGETD